MLQAGDAAAILPRCCFSSVWDKSSGAEGACFVPCGWKQKSPRRPFPDGLPAIVQGMVSGNKTGYGPGIVNVGGQWYQSEIKIMNGHCWSPESPPEMFVLRSCRLPPLKFLGERENSVFTVSSALAEGTQREKMRFGGLHLFLHVLRL